MPIVYDDSGYLATIVWSTTNYDTGGGTTTLAFNGPPQTEPTMLDLLALVSGSVTDNLLPQLDSSFQVSAVRIETAEFSVDGAGLGPGARSGTSVAPQVTLLDSKTAAGKGRRNRGRNYWPSGFILVAELTEAGTVITTRLQALDATFADFFSDIETGDVYSLAIPQSETEEQKSEPILPWPTVVGRSLQVESGTQRRRNRR